MDRQPIRQRVTYDRTVAPVSIRPEREVRRAADRVFREHRQRICTALPDANVEHVGATAVPGAWTKGDVDILVRVGAEQFAAAIVRLKRIFVIHQPHNWTPSLASFVDAEASDLPVGVQLVIAGSPGDSLFAPFRDALLRDPALLAEYNALKRRHDGTDYKTYTDVKGAFVQRVLAEIENAQAGS